MTYWNWLMKVDEIDSFIQQHGVPYSRWYVGITGDVDDRLFGDHRVTSGYIIRSFTNDASARSAEQHFHNKGCKGSHGGGDENTNIVYAYLITRDTVEDC